MQTQKDPVTILPDEIKEIIFDQLSTTDLLNLMLTCKVLNSAIGSNKKLMGKFKVRVSKILKSNCISNRVFTRIIYDQLLKGYDMDKLLIKSFVNIDKSIKEIEFEGHFGIRSTSEIVAVVGSINEIVEICKSFETLIMVKSSRDKNKIPPRQHNARKTLHVFSTSSFKFLSSLPQIEEIFMHDGASFHFNSFSEIPKVKKIQIFDHAMKIPIEATSSISSLDHLVCLEEIIFQNCLIGIRLEFSRLKVLKFIKCKVKFYGWEGNYAPFNPDSAKIDELYIEDCKDCSWLEEVLLSDIKLKHLKLIKMKLPGKTLELLEKNREKFESLTMIEVTCE